MSTMIPNATYVSGTSMLPNATYNSSSSMGLPPVYGGPLLPNHGGSLPDVPSTLLPCPPVIPSVTSLQSISQPVYQRPLTVANDGLTNNTHSLSYHHFNPSLTFLPPSFPPLPSLPPSLPPPSLPPSHIHSHSNLSSTAMFTPLKPHPLPSPSFNWPALQPKETHPLLGTPSTPPPMSCDPIQLSNQSDCTIIRKDASIQTSDSFCVVSKEKEKAQLTSPVIVKRKIKTIVSPQKEFKKSFSTPVPHKESSQHFNKAQERSEVCHFNSTTSHEEEEGEMLSVLLNSQTLATSLVLMRQRCSNNYNTDNNNHILVSPPPPPPSPLSISSPLPSFTTLRDLSCYDCEEEEREEERDDDTEIIKELFFV